VKKWVKRFVPIGIVIAVITSFVFTGIASQKAPSIPSTAEKALVARVIDGDTIQLDDGRKVRLIGVDTPETVHPQKEVEYYGKEASDFTKSMLEGKEVYLEYDIQPTDKYGRTLAYIWLSDGTLFNELLVLKGFAQVATFPPNVKYVERFTAAQKQAIEANAGLWAKESMEKPKAQAKEITVYITKTGNKYHRAGCKYLKKSCIPISLEEAKAEGYTPCKVCNPPE
jgi:micrococcal nuclease